MGIYMSEKWLVDCGSNKALTKGQHCVGFPSKESCFLGMGCWGDRLFFCFKHHLIISISKASLLISSVPQFL